MKCWYYNMAVTYGNDNMIVMKAMAFLPSRRVTLANELPYYNMLYRKRLHVR